MPIDTAGVMVPRETVTDCPVTGSDSDGAIAPGGTVAELPVTGIALLGLIVPRLDVIVWPLRATVTSGPPVGTSTSRRRWGASTYICQGFAEIDAISASESARSQNNPRNRVAAEYDAGALALTSAPMPTCTSAAAPTVVPAEVTSATPSTNDSNTPIRYRSTAACGRAASNTVAVVLTVPTSALGDRSHSRSFAALPLPAPIWIIVLLPSASEYIRESAAAVPWTSAKIVCSAAALTDFVPALRQ